MPRMVPAALLFILTVLQTAAVEDAPAASPEERARIQALIKQLGADDFAEREAATRALQDLAAKAAVELEAAVKSDDVEIQRRATKLLPFTRAWKDEQAWADAMDKTWAEGLKKGELTGPLFGAVALGKNALAAVPAQDALGAKMLAPLAPDEAREDALAWLSLAQAADGSYGGTAYGAQTENRVQLTSFVLLSFLGAGHTERVGLYKANVRRAIEFLVACQREDGAILNPGWRRVDPLSHLLGGLALSEAAGMGRQPFTNEAAKRPWRTPAARCRASAGTPPTGSGGRSTRRCRTCSPPQWRSFT